MDRELTAASSFLASYLAQPSHTFSSSLSAALAAKYEGHWHPHDPERGSAYRALIRTPASLDSSILAAAKDAGLSKEDVERALAGRAGDKRVMLGDRWTLWVDPGCVALRVERDDGSHGRDANLIEVWGKLPETLRGLAVPLADVEASSSNISPPIEPAVILSPVKRSKAIQIVAPPGGRGALQAMTNSALQPSSPAPAAGSSKPTALLASPLIIPPTPVRPLPVTEADVFSPTPAAASSSLLLPPRSPSPGNSSSPSSRKHYSLSPSSYRPSSPLGMPRLQRRSSSRGSSISSLSADSSDGETSGCDSLFSASGDSTASAVSSVHAANGALWKGMDAKSRDLVDSDGFRVPTLPARPSSSFVPSHSRASSSSSLAPPPSPSSRLLFSPSGRAMPGSPTKPRRRGVRGGQCHRSESTHSHSSSISSITSLTSTAIPSTPHQASTDLPSTSPASATRPHSRTETSGSAQTATEYSNGLVKVLGGGVLLGCAKSCGSAAGGRVWTVPDDFAADADVGDARENPL
ncbi:anti-proliferative protein domain containing protein [Rhodotorula toruloides]|uniref:Anti-proliferative protein domain containing protein n=1 Tax=Rhodotorula toruloides TaxID=5286 RepID=A0A511KPV6_RHOTO|nr:anti-proliferative protein domain containing protein [Rhodotorula toruloides]